MPRMWVTKHRIYTHAGVSESYPLYEQPPEVTQWYRFPEGWDEPVYGRYIVHGHTPISTPFVGKHRLNLDTGAVWSNKLSYAIFDSDIPGPPLDVKEVTL